MQSKQSLMTVYLLIFLLSIFTVFASHTVIVNAPSNGVTIGNQALQTINVTCPTCSNTTNWVVVFFAHSEMTANTTATNNLTVITAVNFSKIGGAEINITTTFNVSLFEDGSKYNLSARIQNATLAATDQSTGSATELNFDSGVPTAPGTPTSDNFRNATFTLEATLTARDSTNASITWISGPADPINPLIMTVVGARASLVIANAVTGTYQYRIVASDGLNTTNSVNSYISVNTDDGDGQAAGLAEEGAPALGIAVPQALQEEMAPGEVTKTGSGLLIGAIGGFLLPIPGGLLGGAIIGAILGLLA